MKQHLKRKATAAGLLALLLAVGTGLSAAADGEWPKETVTDAEGKLYKQVFTSGGGVEVWQLIGVYGTPDDALKSVGLVKDEPENKTGTEVIGGKPYTFELKKATSGKNKLKQKTKKRTTVLKPENVVEKTEKRIYGQEQKSKKKLKTKKIRQKRLKDIDNKTTPYNQIYLQENKASGL